MNRQELLQMLDEKGIRYELSEHVPVFTVEEMMEAKLPFREITAKNLFIRDDKKRNYYLITAKEDRPVNLKAFREQFGTRSLTFASEDDLMAIMGLKKGSVTPFGLLNDEERKVQFFLDGSFEKIGVHPMENNATVVLAAADLVELIREHGNTVTII